MNVAREPAGLAARLAAWREGLGWQGVRRSLAVAALLAVLVVVTRWIADLRREPEAADRFIGPPRSDYTLEAFTLTVLGDDGTLSFRGEAPRMTRHPWLGHLDVEAPDFELHTRDGARWRAGAARARVSAAADELRLIDDARIAREAVDEHFSRAFPIVAPGRPLGTRIAAAWTRSRRAWAGSCPSPASRAGGPCGSASRSPISPRATCSRSA